MSTRKDITFKEAFDVFAKTLSENEDMFYGYQSNIAMKFYDAVQEAGINFPQLRDAREEKGKGNR